MSFKALWLAKVVLEEASDTQALTPGSLNVHLANARRTVKVLPTILVTPCQQKMGNELSYDSHFTGTNKFI